MKNNEKRVIWTNDLDYDDWKADLENEFPDISEDERINIMYDLNNDYLADERRNLNVELGTDIILIADLGLWNGRRSGYKEIGRNVKDCLYCGQEDIVTWYVDKNGDLRCDAVHHDGTNYYLYRAFKKNISEYRISEFKNKIYEGDVGEWDIRAVTRRIGPDIAKRYGWRT